MLEANTLYLIATMVVFILIAVVSVHRHQCNDQVARKRGVVDDFVARMNQRTELLEKEIIDLKIKSDELDDEINTYGTGEEA